jgi:cell division protein ZapE
MNRLPHKGWIGQIWPAIWRLHFHDFMVLAQDVIHEARSKGADDPIEMAAADLARRGAVICFDEMEVRDIADAMILARLFSGMLKRGVIVVATFKPACR